MKFTLSVRALTLFVLCFITTLGLQAQATRTWVSGVGDDVNPCSRTAPCKTFAGAISKTQAGGEISVLDPGGFGAVTITKSITIDGAGTLASILASGISGVIVNAGVNDVVTLRNLTINGGTPAAPGVNGVRWLAGKALRVENCEIWNFSNRGISAEVTTASSLFVFNTVIRESGNFGIAVLPSSGSPAINVVLNRVQILGSTQHGALFANGPKVLIRDSNISRNGNVGIQVEQVAGFTEVTIENSTISLNATGISAGPGGTETRLSNVTMSNNSTNGFNYLGGTIVSFGNNRIRNNGGSNAPTSNVGQQ